MVHIILEWIETIQVHIQCPRYKNQMIYYYTFSSTKESFPRSYQKKILSDFDLITKLHHNDSSLSSWDVLLECIAGTQAIRISGRPLWWISCHQSNSMTFSTPLFRNHSLNPKGIYQVTLLPNSITTFSSTVDRYLVPFSLSMLYPNKLT